MIGNNLLRYRDSQKYALFDFETFNLNLVNENPIWQISWIIATKNDVLETHNYFMYWGDKYKISKGAAAITHYDEDAVKAQAKDKKEIYLKFRQVLDDKDIILVAHNGLGFDSLIEKFWCLEVGEKHNWDYLDRYYDTSLIEKAIKKGFKPDLNNFLAWQYKMNSFIEKGLKTNLALLAREYMIKADEVDFHDALYDIRVMMQIFFKQIWKIEI